MIRKVIVTDYNRLPENIEDTWIYKYFKNDYLIYDKFHRFEESENIKHQIDVGVNIYDMFHFIVSNYDNLPDISIFCKDDVIPRHCSVEKFEKIINNTTFTPIENYIRNTPLFTNNIYAYVTPEDEYYESKNEISYIATNIYPCKYIHSYGELMYTIFEDPILDLYIRFAPGANYLIPKSNILKYNIEFYKKMMEIVSWAERPGEAYILERALYTIFNSNLTIQNRYKNNVSN